MQLSYAVKQHLNTDAAHIIFALFFGIVMLSFALTGYYSKEGNLYRANVIAAEEFVRVVKTDWPNNRANVFFALKRMHSAYINTGENATAKFAKLDRLQDWFERSQTASEELLFLNEVRAHGQVIASQPLFCDVWNIFAFSFIAGSIAALLYGLFKNWLQKTDPRLRPFSA